MIQLAPMIFGLPVNASILRCNAIWPVLIPTQGQAPKMPLKRKFTALLNVLAESFRIDVNLMLLAAKCRLKQNLQHRVDSHSKPRQYALACFNEPPIFAVLNKSADKAAINSLLSGVFTSAYPLVLPFVFGKTGRGGYMPDGIDLPLLRTLPLSCRPAFRSAKRLTLTESKGNIMTQIYLQQAAAPTPKSIEAVLKQVSCREIRKHIKTQYSREFAYSANKQAALDSAQFRADSFNGSYAKASGEV